MKRNKKVRISERTKTILFFVSVVLLMLMFAITVWDDLFHKDDETIRQEQEREKRRIQREVWLKNMDAFNREIISCVISESQTLTLAMKTLKQAMRG
ncbi:hypothetical protein, partial [Bacillus cereus]|uniref:hypothetical protein n=1 Tax=Bacillus cereus TaxID=1396 RepID=UPI001155F925